MLWKNLNPYWQISGAWARPIFEKLIQSSILEFWGVTQADFWKTHPNMDKFSKNRPSSCLIFFKNWIGNKNDGWIFQKLVRLMPLKLRFRKIVDEFSKNRSLSRLGKLKFQENFGMSFPGFVNKGLKWQVLFCSNLYF